MKQLQLHCDNIAHGLDLLDPRLGVLSDLQLPAVCNSSTKISQKLAPIWDDLAAEFENNDAVTVAKLDCTVSSALCQEHGVKGYVQASLAIAVGTES